MRHAAPHAAPGRPLTRAAQIALGALSYTIAAAGVALITLGSAFAVWTLWQRLGVS